MDIITAFKQRVEAAIKAHDVAPSTFGHDAVGDPTFVFDLRKSKHEPKLSTIAAVDAHIAKLESAATAKPAKARKRA